MMELSSSGRRYNPVVAEWFRGLIVNVEKINRLAPHKSSCSRRRELAETSAALRRQLHIWPGWKPPRFACHAALDL